MTREKNINKIIKQIEYQYIHEKLNTDWEQEKNNVKKAISAAIKEYGTSYKIIDCIAVAGSRIVLKINKVNHENEINVLKIPRPFKDAIEIAGKDYEITHDLYHPNLVRIYQMKLLKILDNKKTIDLPSTIEEYIPEGKTFWKWVNNEIKLINTEWQMVVFFKNLNLLLTQIIDGLIFLHQNKIYHLDIKPDNILIDTGPSVKIVDFGSSKRRIYNIGYGDDITESKKICYTWKYALPRLRKEIQKMSSQNAVYTLDDKFQFSYLEIDNYELGRTIEEIVLCIEQKRSEIQKKLIARSLQSKFQEIVYKEEYLLLVAMRLKGLNSYDDFEEYKGLADKYSKNIVESIKYTLDCSGLEECKNDIRKIDLEDISEYAPEWNKNINKTIRVGYLDVPFTPRIRRIYNHPSLSRLARISQLGLVTFVYPSARHSRLEHSMGSFAYGIKYLESLWKQKEDPFFRCITTPEEIMAASLTILFHDLGQYPLAHDIEDAFPLELNHAKKAIYMYQNSVKLEKVTYPSLESIIKEEWGSTVSDLVKKYMNKPTLDDRIDDPKWGIFWDILSGPIDVDKLDYVQRDSINLGITYGIGIEVDRLINSLIVIKRGESPKQMPTIALGVTDKGILPARTLIIAREHLFERAYWHKTIRSFKAMLSTALKREFKNGNEIEKLINETIFLNNDNFNKNKFNNDIIKISPESCHLVESDSNLLIILYKRIKDKAAKYLIYQILNRKPYPILIDLNKASWSREFDKNKIERVTQSLQEIFKNKSTAAEELRVKYQKSLHEKNFIVPIDGAYSNPDYSLANEVAILIDFPRNKEEMLQSEIIAYDRKNREELDVNLGILSVGSQQGLIKSTVPRIFINPLFECKSKPFKFIHQLELTISEIKR